MTEDKMPLVGQTDSANNATQDADKPVTETVGFKRTEIKDLPPDVQDYIHELNRENAKWRTEKKKAEEAARKAEEARLEGLQEWKTLAEKRAAQLAELEKVREQADAIEAAFTAGLEARLKAIPEDKRKRLVEPVRKTMSALEFAQWLDANEGDLKAQRPPNLDAGASGGSSKLAVQLSADELTMAQAMGLTPDVYAKRKAERDALRRKPEKET